MGGGLSYARVQQTLRLSRFEASERQDISLNSEREN